MAIPLRGMGTGDEVEIVRVARLAWPGVELEAQVFLDYLGTHGGPCVTDLYLACACSRGDAAALAALEAHVLSVIDPALARLGLPADTTAEVKQRLRTSLLVADGGPPGIVQFAGRGNLRGWVRVIAVREAMALTERDRRLEPLGDDVLAETLLPDSDPELAHLKRFYRAEFRASFAHALGALEDRERLLLRQQLTDGLTVEELGAIHRVHTATAARWLVRARQRVLELTLAQLRQRLAVGHAELDSIMRLIRSQLDVSMGPLARGARRRRDVA